MAKSEDRVVIDSCVFVNFLTGGCGEDDAHWLEHSKRLIEAALGGHLTTFVAAITIPEVLGNGKIRGNHLKQKERRERSLMARDWFRSSNFIVIELSAPLAYDSGLRGQKSQLRGADATIFESAISARVNTIYTWDTDLLKLDGENSVEVKKPSDYLPPGGPDLFDEFVEA